MEVALKKLNQILHKRGLKVSRSKLISSLKNYATSLSQGYLLTLHQVILNSNGIYYYIKAFQSDGYTVITSSSNSPNLSTTLNNTILLSANISFISSNLSAVISNSVDVQANLTAIGNLSATINNSIELSANVIAGVTMSATIDNSINVTANISAVGNMSASLNNLINISANIIDGSASITLLHIMMAGQSQVRGVSATPRLGHATNSNVLMLGGHPIIEPETLQATIDNYAFNTAEEVAVENSLNVDTMSVAIGRDLLNKLPSSNYKVCTTIVAKPTSGNDELMRGGNTGAYETSLIVANRVKALADTNGWVYKPIYIWMHGGTVSYRYNTLLRVLYEDLLLDYPSSDQLIFLYDQIRQRDFVGSSYYDPSAWSSRIYTQPNSNEKITLHYINRDYEYFGNDDKIIMSHPRSQVERAGDAVHHSANGMRHNAALHAESIYRLLNSQTVEPLRLGNPTWNGTIITAEILGTGGGTPTGSGNYGVSLYDIDADAEVIPSSVVINAGNIEITPPPSLSDGFHRLLVYTNYNDEGGNANQNRYPWSSLYDTTLGEMHVPFTPSAESLFDDDNTSSPYDQDKYLIRQSLPINIEIVAGDDTFTHVSMYQGAESIDLVLEQNGVEKTAYIVGYTSEDAGRTSATIKTDAAATGGAFRAVINNTGDVNTDQEITLTDGDTNITINENIVYYVHVVVEDSNPTEIESGYRSVHTRIRHENIIYVSDARGWIKGFKLYVPEGYWKRKNPTTEWGWKFGLHGNGEKAPTNSPVTGEAYNLSLLTNNFAGAVSGGTNFDDIIISPHWHEDVPNRDDMYHILVNICEKDLGLVLKEGGMFFGLSGGGGIGYSFAQKYPERVACIISSAAFTRYDGSGDGNLEWTEDLGEKAKWYWDIPIIGHHHTDDGTVNSDSTTEIINAVNALTGAITAPVAAVHLGGTGGHSGWQAIVNHTESFASVPNANNEEEFYAYHEANNYSFLSRISNAIVVAETTEVEEDKTRAQVILNRNQDLIDSGTLATYQARIDAVVPAPDITVTPSTKDFGSIALGIPTPPTQVFVISNDGTQALTITSATITDTDGGVFTITAGEITTDTVLQVDETHNITVEYDPDIAEIHSGNLRILSDSPGEETTDVTLAGTGSSALLEEIRINMKHSTAADYTAVSSPYYNNTVNRFSGVQIADLVDINNASTGLSFEHLDSFGASRDTNGVLTGGYHPDTAAESMLQDDASGVDFRFNNVPSGIYTVRMLSTYDAGGNTRESTFTVNGGTPQTVASRNLTNLEADEVVFTGITPDGSDRININMLAPVGSNSCQINILTLIQTA